MSTEQLLFNSLRCALWNISFDEDVSPNEFYNLLRLAEEQTVVALVCDVMSQKKIDVKQQLLMEYIGMNLEIENQNRILNKELVSMIDALNVQKLEHIVVKGQTIACLYSKPYLRQSGDIDFVVKDNYAKAKNLTEKALGVSLPERISEKEIGFDKKGVRYELHTHLRTFFSKRHQLVWTSLMEKEWKERTNVMIEGVKVRTLSPTINAIYVFIHLFFHFTREGVSLRQFCDWAMVLHHYREEIDRDKLLQILLDLDLFDAYCAFGTILVDKLGLPQQELPVPINDGDRKWQKKILEDMFRGGNFGQLNHQANGTLRYKMETLKVAFRNSFKYYRLCPSEVGGMIPRLVKGNVKILLKRSRKY